MALVENIIIFDEFHNELCSIRPEIARKISPEYPSGCSLNYFANLLMNSGFEVKSAYPDLEKNKNDLSSYLYDAEPSFTMLIINFPNSKKGTCNKETPFNDFETIYILEYIKQGMILLITGNWVSSESELQILNSFSKNFDIKFEPCCIVNKKQNDGLPVFPLVLDDEIRSKYRILFISSLLDGVDKLYLYIGSPAKKGIIIG